MLPALLSRTRVVLVHPFFPENVGAVARAMKVTGFSRLALVGGPPPLHENALKLAVGATDVLEAASVHADLDEALAGVPFVVGTSPHAFSGWTVHAPREAAALAAPWAERGDVALVFGNEKNGLSVNALNRCHVVLRIPHLEVGPSLNLAQAAMVVAYEWMVASGEGAPDAVQGPPAVANPARLAELEGRLLALLEARHFLKPHHARKKAGALRRILGRLQLTREEVALLQGVVSALEP